MRQLIDSASGGTQAPSKVEGRRESRHRRNRLPHLMGRANRPSRVYQIRGATEEATGLSAIAGRKVLATAEAYTETYVRTAEEGVRYRQCTDQRIRKKVVIGSLECIRCKARRSVGPETYVSRYFEDHARLRTQQMMCFSEPH